MTSRITLTPADSPVVVHSMSEEETVAAGGRLGRLLKAGDVVAIFGDLGAGKTRFVRGICRALGTVRAASSPTFTLLHEYHAPGLAVYHFDFYRIASASELAGIGFAEYLDRGDGVCVIEWADRVEPFLPADRYEVRMRAGGGSGKPDLRVIEISKVSGAAR
ncbi:MAG TPA: tRNA (adenosine(37)-N6)-threonylcarbamoyltransferase complex ATPase subunit type 1 TsaE [Bacteroidota bacterium]|nr:tRNA (adenosine(37)-N6)-threonylcarbamoyltransferase complex ATPase subunit type 1 TsaE [Bacteroidota bacterium]